MAHRQEWTHSTGGAEAVIAPSPISQHACPACRAPVDNDWKVCAECGAAIGQPGPRLKEAHREAVLPSPDNEDLAFVPFVGGPKRPITIVEAGPRLTSGPTITLDALVTHKGPEGRPPPEPPTENSQHQVTIAHQPPNPAPVAAEPPIREAKPAAQPELEEEEPAVELAVKPPSPAPEIPEGASMATNIPPTVVVRSQERSQVGYITQTDLAEIQVMIEEAVRRALREHVAAQAANVSTTTTATVTSASTAAPPGRVGAVGAGLLLGGAIADILVLNWDMWVRGDAVNAVGWVQQIGVIGGAAIAGAGISAVLIAASLRRRARQRTKLEATRSPSRNGRAAASRTR